jgi:hypothetical protein
VEVEIAVAEMTESAGDGAGEGTFDRCFSLEKE